jgi:hypothetical protein
VSAGVIHIAAVDVRIGQHLRQRCGWCGAVLIDYDLARIAVPVGQDPTPAVWPYGSLVLVAGGISVSVEHEDGQPLPEGSCGHLDPEVTR